MAYQVPQFDDAKDKWSSYYICVESYFEGNDIVNDAKERALLISALGSKLIDVLSGRCAPRKAYLDDVLVAEKGNDGGKNLKAVLQRFREYGVKVRKDKCTFRMPEVSYLGYKISTGGLQPLEKNMGAIMKAPTPNNVTELRSYLGLLTLVVPEAARGDMLQFLHVTYQGMQIKEAS
nr:uncharacterized protein K02A2.6-like [Dermacentor andersoni]